MLLDSLPNIKHKCLLKICFLLRSLLISTSAQRKSKSSLANLQNSQFIYPASRSNWDKEIEINVMKYPLQNYIRVIDFEMQAF